MLVAKIFPQSKVAVMNDSQKSVYKKLVAQEMISLRDVMSLERKYSLAYDFYSAINDLLVSIGEKAKYITVIDSSDNGNRLGAYYLRDKNSIIGSQPTIANKDIEFITNWLDSKDFFWIVSPSCKETKAAKNKHSAMKYW